MLYSRIIKNYLLVQRDKFQIQWREIDELRGRDDEKAHAELVLFIMNIVAHFGNYKLAILFKSMNKNREDHENTWWPAISCAIEWRKSSNSM